MFLTLLVTLISLSVSPVMAAGMPAPNASLQTAPAGWLLFQNSTWKYTISYPPNWTAATTLSNASSRPLEVIRQRDMLTGLLGASVTIDTWQKSPATDLMSWINANQRQMLDFAAIVIPAAPNAVIAGQPALILGQAESGMSPGSMMAYINAADRILLVQYIAGDYGSALDTFQTMLDTITISPLGASLDNQPKSIPDLQMPPSEAGHKGGTCVLAPNSEGCCGHPRVSHWRCAADSVTGDHKSNCVYWAALMRPDVGAAVGSGNANQWAIKAAAAGMDVDTTPRVGDIMVSESLSVYGHVAYVIAVSSTTVTVTEMNWCSQCPERTHVYSISGKKFIHGDPVEGPSLIAPTGQLNVNKPTYSWTSVEDTTKYVLNVLNSAGALMYENAYTPADICNEGICTITPPSLLVNDTYVWKVQAQRSDSTAPWSTAKAFSVGIPSVPTSPTGTVHSAQPTFTWQNVLGAASYNLQINLPDQIIFEEEYLASEICEGSTCSVTPESLDLDSGTYTWRVETLDSNGIGPWSEDLAFQILTTSGETVSLKGNITLPGRPAAPDPRWVTTLTIKVTSTAAGSTSQTFTVSTDTSGQFTLNDLAAGEYNLLVKPAGALQKSLPGVTLQGGENLIDFGAFKFGDANGDNYVNATDFSLLSAAYSACQGDARFNLASNFNGDDCITATDFSLLSASYGTGGDQ
jgi:surface antigen